MREIFVPRNFKTKLARLEQANAILADYAGQGWQLFYQFVARQLVENMQAKLRRSRQRISRRIGESRAPP